MRIADPVELSPDKPLESVLTAVMPRFVVDNLSNAMDMVDQFNAPGPARMAVLRLDSGPTVAIVHHEASNLLEVLAPLDGTVEAALAEVLTVLRVPQTSVEWVREGLSLSEMYKTNAAIVDPDSSRVVSPSLSLFFDPVPPQTRFWRVAASESFTQKPLAASASISLTLLLVRLMHSAGEVEPVDSSGIRLVQMPDTILFEDGAEAAALAVYYRISDDGSTALILEVKELVATRVHMAKGTLKSVIETARLADARF